MSETIHVAVLISGHGSNLQAIIDATEDGRLPGIRIVAVISDKADAFGLQRARQHGIPGVHFPYPPRSCGPQALRERDMELAALLEEYGANWIVLAGWMRLLSSALLDRFPMRVMNIHPALPGQFPGLDAIDRALEASQAGEIRETGAMVHLVPDEAVDAGPVLSCEAIPIYAEDSLQALTERIHQVEHRLLVATLSRLSPDE